jgi:Holliday junction resolvasome RuvABC endonuclease subunit
VTAFGLDLSTKRIGLARPDGTTTSITARAGASDPYRRLHELVTGVSHEFRRWPGTPLAVVEGYAIGAVPGRWALVRLGELGGSIRLLAWELGIATVDVSPSSLKLAATGNGGAKKDVMIEAAIAAGGRPGNHDEADAWHLHDLGRRALAGEELPEKLASLPWPIVR